MCSISPIPDHPLPARPARRDQLLDRPEARGKLHLRGEGRGHQGGQDRPGQPLRQVSERQLRHWGQQQQQQRQQ